MFLDLDCLEAFYGGAAAGGKSEALLMAALQHVHVPRYSALILRKDLKRLSLPGGLIPRSHEWLSNTGATWHGGERRWSFPTDGAPATLSFGYLQDPTDRYRYNSSEFQFIAFDELTEFPEEDYLFLFSRLRKTTELSVPLRMRSASNPGNLGHAWVKKRFITNAGLEGDASLPGVIVREDRAYVPARIADNPAVDEAEYRRTLSHLPTIERERLMNGDWNIRGDGLIRPHWLRYYQEQGRELWLLDGEQDASRPLIAIDERDCRRFVTIDPAGTSQQRADEHRGRPASWSVVGVWDQPVGEHRRHLLLREIRRERVGFDGLCRLLQETYRRWQPARMLIENEKLGQAAVDVLGRELPIVTISTQGRDKVARAAPLLVKLERGEIWLPRLAVWRSDFESELLNWTGLPQETSDQIDVAAYAVLEAEEYHGPVLVERLF